MVLTQRWRRAPLATGGWLAAAPIVVANEDVTGVVLDGAEERDDPRARSCSAARRLRARRWWAASRSGSSRHAMTR